MKQTNNNLSALPFYRQKRLQFPRLPYTYGELPCLIAPSDRLLPFQIMFDAEDKAALTAEMYCYCPNGEDKLFADVTQKLKDASLRVAGVPEYGIDIAVFTGNYPIPDMPEGLFYLKITYGSQTAFSEVFRLFADVSDCTMIEWCDREDAVFDSGVMLYPRFAYKNRLFVRADIGKPEYKYDEEGEERDGYFFPEKQISEKTYKCSFIAIESICDMLRLATLSDIVTVTDRFGRVYDCDTFLSTVDWESEGDFATVECEFETDTVVKKLGTVLDTVDKGDYNEDYNNDYDNN